MSEAQRDRAMAQRAVGQAAVVFKRSSASRVLVKVASRNVIVLASDRCEGG